MTRVMIILRMAACAPMLLGGHAWAVHSCSVSVTGTGMIYVQGVNANDAAGTVVLTCTRSASDANTLTYRIKAEDGLQPQGNQRRVQLGATTNRLDYSLSRGTTAGGSASCANTSNWQAPANGTNDVITGTLNFGSGLTASVTWGYCIRVRGNQGAPAAGIYTDLVGVFAQYPDNNGGALSPVASLNVSVGVSNQCVFSAAPGMMSFNYTAFAPVAQTASTSFDLRCSNGLPWSVSVSPDSATLQGLRYSIAASPDSGVGNGNSGQTVTLNGSMPAGQAGTCPAASCSAQQAHTVMITY